MKFHAQKQIGKSHVIHIFTSEDMENISRCIFQYLTLYYIINIEYLKLDLNKLHEHNTTLNGSLSWDNLGDNGVRSFQDYVSMFFVVFTIFLFLVFFKIIY